VRRRRRRLLRLPLFVPFLSFPLRTRLTGDNLADCLSNDFSVTAANACGATGSFCQDAVAVDSSLSVEAAQLVFNQFCSSGYCSSTYVSPVFLFDSPSLTRRFSSLFSIGNCAVLAAENESCLDDPEFQCAAGLTCDQTSFTCKIAPVISARARERRSAHAKKSLCPASHSACSVEGARGFECVDTTVRLRSSSSFSSFSSRIEADFSVFYLSSVQPRAVRCLRFPGRC
jgi:hypothetical protein